MNCPTTNRKNEHPHEISLDSQCSTPKIKGLNSYSFVYSLLAHQVGFQIMDAVVQKLNNSDSC